MAAKYEGSKFFLAATTTATYPTDGQGGIGTGTPTVDSDLKDSVECVIDRVVLTRVSASSIKDIIFRDIAGTVLFQFEIDAAKTAGDSIELHARVSAPGGFTCEVETNSSTAVLVFYRNRKNAA